jgi:hypothetical protein
MATFLNTKHRIFTLSEQSAPSIPLTGYGSIFLSSITGDLSIVKDNGAVIDLEDHDALTNYVSNEHIDHTSVLFQGAANSGLNIDAGISAIDLTAGTKQITMAVNNLATAAAIDPITDLIALYDTSTTSTVNDTIQNVLNSGIVSSMGTILTTRGDVLIRDDTEPARLPVGPDGNFLFSDGTDISWSSSTKRINILSKDITVSGASYTTSLQDNQILNIITSSGNDIINLPDATTLPDGWTVNIVNNKTSTTLLNVKLFDNTTLQIIGIGSSITFALLDNTTQNGTWSVVGKTDHNIVNVGLTNAAFTTINDAMASITDASLTNQYQIRVSPGNYTETTITMKPFVSIYSNAQRGTNIIASDPTQIIINASSNSSISNLTITGATGVGGIGVNIDGVVIFVLSGCLFYDCETAIKASATVASSPTVQCLIDSNNISSTGNIGLWIDGTVATSNDIVKLVLKNNSYGGSATGLLIPSMLIEGPQSECSMLSEYFSGDGINGIGIIARDGADVHMIGTEFVNMNIGIDNQNVGAPCNMLLTGVSIYNSITSGILISNTSTTGYITGAFNNTNSSILSTLFSVSSLDSTNNDISIFGNFRVGDSQSNATNVTDAINNPSLGIYSGGELTTGTGLLDIDVGSGLGYVQINAYTTSHTGKSIRRIAWVDDTITLPVSTTSYVYVDNTSSIISSTSRLNTENQIFLGIVRTDSTTIEFISRTNVDGENNSDSLYNYIREILKNQYVSGSITTANASRQLQITPGAYYSDETRYVPSGVNSPATFYQYNHSASAWVFASATVVNNTQYDNGTNLTALTASYFSKHALYIIGDSSDERYMLVIGQTEFVTLNDAVTGFLPNNPTWFNGTVTIIASLIMQEGVSTVNTILDERPFLGSTGATGSAGVSDHGNLTGLSNDDHTQYLLVGGSRAMAGVLNMGTNAITNVGLVDGVDISAHASRHLPNGADALTTAAPVTNVSVSSTNAVGTANSFARSNHTHALTLSIDDITPTTTKGDLLVENATVATRLAVGTNDQILTADSAQLTGMKWASATAATILTYNSVTATATTSTTAITYQVINGMQITPVSGTYNVTFSTTLETSTNNMVGEYAIFVAGVIQQVSHRLHEPKSGGSRLSVYTQAVVTVNGSQTVDVRWLVNTGTLSCYERSMLLLRIA